RLAGRGPPSRQAAHLSGRPGGAGGAARRARSVLEPDAGRVQADRGSPSEGAPMSGSTSSTTVHASIVVDAPIERAFAVFTGQFGRFKPPEHNMLGVEIAETVF